jgi:hypothetical protein
VPCAVVEQGTPAIDEELPEQRHRWRRRPVPGPHDPDGASRLRSDRHLGRADRETAGLAWQQREPEAGGHQTADGVDVVALEGQPRREAGPVTPLVGDPADPVAGLETDERLPRELTERQPVPPGQRMTCGQQADQPLDTERPGRQIRFLGQRRRETDVDGAGPQPGQHRVVGLLMELEADPGMAGAELLQQPRHHDRPQGVHEAQVDPTPPGVGVEQDVPQPAVQHFHRILDRLTQRLPSRGQPHPAARPHQQRDAELLLEPGHPPAQRRLRDAQHLGGARHVQFVRQDGELREPRGDRGDRFARLFMHFRILFRRSMHWTYPMGLPSVVV